MAKKPATTGSAADLAAKIRKKFGAQSIVVPGDDDPRSQVRGVVASGIDVVDRYVLGCGGLAYGRISELYSEQGVGKTTFVWALIAAAQRNGIVPLYCDNEHSWNNERAASLGIDLSSLALMQPLSLEDALAQMQHAALMVTPETPTIMIWDSLAGSTSVADLEGGYEKQRMDPRAIKCGQFVRVMTNLAAERQFHLLIVNQSRQKRGVLFGDATTTPGGDQVKFAASQRIQLFGGKALKDSKTNQHTGKTVTFLATKTRFSPPFRKAKVRLDYATGWDNLWSTINLAKDLGLVPPGDKYTVETYQKAVTAFGWKDVAAPVAARTTTSDEDTSEDDLAEWAGEKLEGEP